MKHTKDWYKDWDNYIEIFNEINDELIEEYNNSIKEGSWGQVMDAWKIIFYKIRSKHPNWSNKQIKYCTRYAYRRCNGRLIKDFKR